MTCDCCDGPVSVEGETLVYNADNDKFYTQDCEGALIEQGADVMREVLCESCLSRTRVIEYVPDEQTIEEWKAEDRLSDVEYDRFRREVLR